MRAGDEPAAEQAWDRAIRTLQEDRRLPMPPRTEEAIRHDQRRIAHLRATDPGGSWVAETDGRIVGLAQAHIRGGVWVLALLGVVPDFQDHGIGRELLDRALAYGDPSLPGAIFSSPDPRALHRYVTAGFDLHPTAAAFGPVRRAVEAPAGIRVGTAADLAQVNAVDRTVRGSERQADIEYLLSVGAQLLIDPDGGHAAVRGGRVATLSAVNEAIGTGLLLAAFSRCSPGDEVGVSWITAEQGWAVRAAVSAGVTVEVHGAIMMRGPWQPALPYLANGAFG